MDLSKAAEPYMNKQKLLSGNNYLEQLLSINSTLIQAVMDGKGFDELTAILAELIKCAVVLEDAHFTNRSFSFGKEQLALGEQMKPCLSALSSPSFQKFFKNCRQKKLLKTCETYEERKIYRIISPIIAQKEVQGYLSLLRTNSPFSDFEMAVIQQVADIFALLVAEEKKIAEIELRLKGNFIEDLISGNYSDPISIINRAHAFNYEITRPHRVLVAQMENPDELEKRFKQDQKKILQFKNELVKTIQNRIDKAGKGMAICRSSDLIILVQDDKTDSSIVPIKELAEEIIKEVSGEFKVKLYIGIGSLCTEMGSTPNLIFGPVSFEIGEFTISQASVLIDQ
jgi:hypothetical protein